MRSKFMKSVLAAIACASATASCGPDSTLSTGAATEPIAQRQVADNVISLRLASEGGRSITTLLPRQEANAVLSRVAEAARLRADDGRADLEARMMAFVKKGPPALVLVDRALADGAIAEVYLNSTGPVSRFMVIPRATLNDEIIDRAYALAKNYEIENPDATNSVKFTLAPNGDFTRTSKGEEFRARQRFEGFYSNSRKDRRSRWLLESAARVAIRDVPGIGRGRIMSLGETRAK